MAFDSPAYVMDGTTIDGEVMRRAIGSLISPYGGIVTPGDLAVAQQAVPNMSVQIGIGQCWIPGTSSGSQGMYYSRNGAPVTVTISAANATNPRIDMVVAQVIDQTYAGSGHSCAPVVMTGTPTAGATIVPGAGYLAGVGAAPASSMILAYVLVPANATSIVTADILNIAPPAALALGISGSTVRGAVNIATTGSRTNTVYGFLNDANDQVAGIVLPTNGLIAVWYQAQWQEGVAGAARAAIFVGSNQLQLQGYNGSTRGPQTQAAATGSATATIYVPLHTTTAGLASIKDTAGYAADAATGQIVGASSIGQALSMELGGAVSTVGGLPLGGPCYVFATAGTYTVSVQFKATSGAVSVASRRLWAQALPFS